MEPSGFLPTGINSELMLIAGMLIDVGRDGSKLGAGDADFPAVLDTVAACARGFGGDGCCPSAPTKMLPTPDIAKILASAREVDPWRTYTCSSLSVWVRIGHLLTKRGVVTLAVR